ncbi:hypothetical protein WJX73_002168 [Symbiochloris irregularis]|uniref:Protein transport protein SEC23 n=1 Tax=Symbiochloris irregularis TaxID=706552 RepID=A0AAW1P1H1_9CHLO
MADFTGIEEREGLRLSWNLWPNSKIEATKCVLPFGALYTPIKDLPDIPVVNYEPVQCKGCGGILNPYAQVDFAARVWMCRLCQMRNSLPSHYHGISEQNLPAELYQEYPTVEYSVPRTRPIHPPAYMFVVDTCLAEDELAACKAALSQALHTLPEYAYVGLITFGTHVHVHELGFQDFAKAYVFQATDRNGPKDHPPQAIAAALGMGPKGRGQTQDQDPNNPVVPGTRFTPPLSECEFVISNVIEELQKDAFPATAGHRPSRCTGAAIQVAAGVMAACLPPGTGAARLMLFVGGPTTLGPGKVVDTDLLEPIRSHKDLAKDAAQHFKPARRYYDGLATQLASQEHALDVFACSLDQVGLAEMQNAVDLSGGLIVQTDSFNNAVFKDSFKRVLAGPEEPNRLSLHSNATFEVIPSRDVKVGGLMGPAAPVEKKSPSVADTQTGIGGTTLWKMASLDTTTTVAVFFEIVAHSKGSVDRGAGANQQFFVQFVTRYLHADGSQRVRAYTFTRQWVDDKSTPMLMAGFDQEAAAVLTARVGSWKMEGEEEFDATRWLDRLLIRVCSRFGDYQANDPRTFDLQPAMAMFPQFMFNLRRSNFVQVFGNSPDETAFFRLSLNRFPVADAMVAIQPSLVAFSLSDAPQPVLLDVASITADRILFLDACFSVVIFHGATIAQWRKQEFHLQADYAGFKDLLEAPQAEATAIRQRRFPVPRLVDCDQNGSQARFLLARLNPSSTYNSAGTVGSEMIMTDDVSLHVFTEHLRKLAVQS